MRNIITPAVLSTMIPQEFEDWRDGGEDLRRELTCPAAVEHVCPPCHMRVLFLRVLSGSSRINTTVAQRIPGLNWEPKNRLTSLKQVEEALDRLISSHGEYCPLPLSVDVQAELFPEVIHARTDRRMQREKIAFNRKMRREEKALEHAWLLRQNLLGQAMTELNFQSPETVNAWYTRWADEFDARELAQGGLAVADAVYLADVAGLAARQ